MESLVNIHTHQQSPLNNEGGEIRLLNIDRGRQWPLNELTYLSAGLHPWITAIDYREHLEWLERIIVENKKVIAVGEIGLDKNCSTDIILQEEVFIKQLALAAKNHLPVIIHNVRATGEILSIQKKYSPISPFIFHGFRGKFTKAAAILESGNYLSFGAGLLLNDTSTLESFKKTPIERLFLETDDSTSTILEIYSKAAEIRNVSLDQLAKEIWNNFTGLFKFSRNE